MAKASAVNKNEKRIKLSNSLFKKRQALKKIIVATVIFLLIISIFIESLAFLMISSSSTVASVFSIFSIVSLIISCAKSWELLITTVNKNIIRVNLLTFKLNLMCYICLIQA